MPARSAIGLCLLAGCTFSVDPFIPQVADASIDLEAPGAVDDLSRPNDLVMLPDSAPDLSCSPSCVGVTCGQLNACGAPCCAAGCTPIVCGACQAVNACGNLCQTVPDNTACALDMASGFCTAGVCTSAPVEHTVFGNDAPTGSVNVGNALELGMKFSSGISGSVVRLRYYKLVGMGMHTGHLWDGSGTLLATVPFTMETASGWQEATLPSPVPIAAGATYVASYSTTTGFAWDAFYFLNAKDAPPLHVPANGGVFANAVATFPTLTFESSNYWVDIVLR